MRFIEMREGDTCGNTRIDLASKCELLLLRTTDQDEWAFHARPKRQLVGEYEVLKVEHLPELLTCLSRLSELVPPTITTPMEYDKFLEANQLAKDARRLIEATGPWEVHQLNDPTDLDGKGNEK